MDPDHHRGGTTMKICPIAIAVGCPKCPAFKVCPVKGALGGYVEEPAKKPSASKGPHGRRK
jgi:hypothetical protein